MSIEVTEENIIAALELLRNNDTNSVQQASEWLLQVMNNPTYLHLFFSILCKDHPDFIRQLCGLFCRRMILQFYKGYDVASRENMKQISINLLRNEKNNLVKRAICGMISAIASFEIPDKGWNEMRDVIINNIHSDDWQDRESSVLLLFSICQYINLVFDADSINQLLITGMQDSVPEVVYMTIKAAVSVFTNCILSKIVKSLLPSIQYSMQLFPILLSNHCEEYALLLLSAYTEIIVSSLLSDDFAYSLLQLTLPYLQDSSSCYELCQSAASLIVSIIRYYSVILLKNNLVHMFITTCIDHLSDDITENEEDDETRGALYELILDQTASILPDEMVFNEVIQYCSCLITSTSWQQRRAALTAMLVIIEYTSDLYHPLLSDLLLQIRPLLFDPVRVVRRKAAFFFSEIADYCEDIFIDSAPFIVQDIQQIFASNDEFDITSIMHIIECCPSIFEKMDTEGVLSSINTLMTVLMNASQTKTQSLALSCLYTVIDAVPEKAATAIPSCIQVAYQILMQPFSLETNDIHSKALDLLAIIIQRCGIQTIFDILPSILQHLSQLVSSVEDIEMYSSIFPFIGVIIKNCTDTHQNDLNPLVDPFIPILEHCLFDLSTYVDIDLPSASTEYGNLGGSFGTDEKQSYRLVHVDPNRVECKCTALDTYMVICKYRLESTKQCLSSEMIDSVMSFIIKTCQEENDSLRIHGYKAATEMIQILYNSETLQDSNTEHAQSIRYSLIILHIIYIRLTQIEKEEDVAISQLSYVIQMMGNLRLPFIMNGSNEILSILKEGFQYNLPCLEDYVDPELFTILHDYCPVFIKLLRVFQIFLVLTYPQNFHDISLIKEYWEYIAIHLVSQTDGLFLESIFYCAQHILMMTGSSANFLLSSLPNFLLYSLDNPNEGCRGRACCCLGWLCQCFPDEMRDSIDTIIDSIGKAMQKRKGDSGICVDYATAALTRILKNMINSPKQKLFVNVLDNLPPMKDTSQAEYVYETLFDMHDNKGELYIHYTQPYIRAFLRTLMIGSHLDSKILEKVKQYLFMMSNEDPQSFMNIINSFSQEEVQFASQLFSYS